MYLSSERIINSEADLVAHLVEFLSATGYRVRVEVPNLGQSADIVGTKNRWVTFFEAKMKDWRRAIQQCRAHENVADYVCIALAMKSVPARLAEELRSSGYGLIIVNTDDLSCHWHTIPRRNHRIWQPQRRRLAATLKGIDYV